MTTLFSAAAVALLGLLPAVGVASEELPRDRSAKAAAHAALSDRADLPDQPPRLPDRSTLPLGRIPDGTQGKAAEAVGRAKGQAQKEAAQAAKAARADAANRAAQGNAASAARSATGDERSAAGQARARAARARKDHPGQGNGQGPKN